MSSFYCESPLVNVGLLVQVYDREGEERLSSLSYQLLWEEHNQRATGHMDTTGECTNHYPHAVTAESLCLVLFISQDLYQQGNGFHAPTSTPSDPMNNLSSVWSHLCVVHTGTKDWARRNINGHFEHRIKLIFAEGKGEGGFKKRLVLWWRIKLNFFFFLIFTRVLSGAQCLLDKPTAPDRQFLFLLFKFFFFGVEKKRNW